MFEFYIINVIWLYLGFLFVGVVVIDSIKLLCILLIKRNKFKFIKEGVVFDIM